MVSSSSVSLNFFVTSEPRIVPRERLILSTFTSIRAFSPVSRDFFNFGRNTFSSMVFSSSKSYLSFGLNLLSLRSPAKVGSNILDRSTRSAYSSASPVSSFLFRRSTRPIRSSSLRTPSAAIYSLSSLAINFIKFSTYSGFPRNLLRSSGFWVATPTGHVSRLQTRIITQPMVISGAVAKPNSSAPSIAAMATSRPVISLPSVSMRTRERRPFMISV